MIVQGHQAILWWDQYYLHSFLGLIIYSLVFLSDSDSFRILPVTAFVEM